MPTNNGRAGSGSPVVRTATPATVRQVNRAIVLKLIRMHQPISRIQLSKLTGIYRSNVSAIVQELLDERLVREERSEESKRGRVPLMLSVNSNAVTVIGTSMRAQRTTVALANLTGGILASVDFPNPQTPAAWAAHLAQSVKQMRAKHGIRRHIHHICISVPGTVNRESGSLLWVSPLPSYSGFEMRSALEDLTGVPTTVGNDCDLATAFEQWMTGNSVSPKDFVFLEIGDVGVGAGVVVNGELCTGHDATFAGELGHMVIDRSGPVCTCGRHGCLETFVCDRATWSRFDRKRQFTKENFDRLLKLANQQDPQALAALCATVDHLAVGIANIVMMLNPETIIVAGKLTEAWDVVHARILSAINILPARPKIQPARMPAEELFLRGAISKALSGVFADPKLG